MEVYPTLFHLSSKFPLFLCYVFIMLVNLQLSNVLDFSLKSFFDVMGCHLQSCYITAPLIES